MSYYINAKKDAIKCTLWKGKTPLFWFSSPYILTHITIHKNKIHLLPHTYSQVTYAGTDTSPQGEPLRGEYHKREEEERFFLEERNKITWKKIKRNKKKERKMRSTYICKGSFDVQSTPSPSWLIACSASNFVAHFNLSWCSVMLRRLENAHC